MKLDDTPLDGPPVDNNPHQACNLVVSIYGYKSGTHTADVVFSAQPPSGRGVVPVLSGNTHLTFTGAPGNTKVKTETYSLDLSKLTMQPQQGYHIDLHVTIDNNTQGAKNKEFWVQPCAAPPTPTVTPTLTLSAACATATTVTWTVLATWTSSSTSATKLPVTNLAYKAAGGPNVSLTGTLTPSAPSTTFSTGLGVTATATGKAGTTSLTTNTVSGPVSCSTPPTPPTPTMVTITIAKQWVNSDGTTYTGTVPAGGPFVNVTYTGGVGTIHEGGSFTVPVNTAYVVTEPSPPTGWAVLSGVGTFTATTTTTAVVVNRLLPVTPPGMQDLVLTKAVDKATAEYGDTLTYTLTVTAVGVTQTGVVVTDKIPDGATYVAGSATCAAPCTASYNPGQKTVTWMVGTVAAGTSVTGLVFKVTIDTPATTDGTLPVRVITNVGSVMSNELPPTPSNPVTTTVVAVLGERQTRPPTTPTEVAGEEQQMPFTGSPIALMVAAGLTLVGTGTALALRRSRDD